MKLQEIRARQALSELGREDDVRIEHREPATYIGEKKYSLVFPRFILSYPTEKDIEVIFVGKITPPRQAFLERARRELVNRDVTFINSLRGRQDGVRERDDEYFRALGRARFGLCPNGDFVWTYRFFETVLLKAIPIVEQDCELYEGYKYFKLGDVLEYRQDWVEHNLSKAKEQLML